MKVKSLSHVQLFAIPWTVAYQVPLSVEFSRQEYESELLFPSPGDLPDLGIGPRSPALAGGFFTIESPGKPDMEYYVGVCLLSHFSLTLCNPMNCNPPGFSIHGVLQARVLEWVAIPFSRGSS